MSDIRNGVLRRMLARAKLLSALATAADSIEDAILEVGVASMPGESHTKRAALTGLDPIIRLHSKVFAEDDWRDADQLGFLIATEIVVPLARSGSDTDPIVWLTGNAYVPAWREVDGIDDVYSLDTTGEIYNALIERIESVCDSEGVYIGYPEDDNSIYVVDLKRWQYIERDGGLALNYSDEWERKT